MKHELILFKIGRKNDKESVGDSLIYSNQCVPKKKNKIFLGKHGSQFVCRRCFHFYSSQNILIKHRQRCDQQEKTAFKTSIETHIFWKK